MAKASQAQLFADLARSLQHESGREATLDRVTGLVVAMIDGCDWAGITVTRRKKFETVAATGPLVLELDRKQYELGEGPCVSAAGAAEVQLISDISTEPRWPVWTPYARQAGVGAVLSVHLGTISESVGALNLYARRVDAFDTDDVITAQLFAAHAAGAIVSANTEDGLTIALRSRHLIGLAQGMLMARYQLNEDQAFRFMIRTSQNSNVKVHVLAEDIIRELSAGR